MVIGCFGEVNEAMLAYVGEMLIQAGVAGEDVTVLISTYGGELYPALGIYDLLKHHAKDGKKVTTIAVGHCMSAGMVILQAGTRRAMMPHAFLMTHYGADASESKSDAEHNDLLHKIHRGLVCQYVNVKTRTINNWYNKDTYFDATHALKVGLVDEVIDNE